MSLSESLAAHAGPDLLAQAEDAVGGLDARSLMEAALRRAGRSRFADMSFVEPLQRLLHSYRKEAKLNAFGRRAVRFDILRSLHNLLSMDAAEEADPGIRKRHIARPLFITGLPRSSSTFLHMLLAQDPDNAVPRCWQLIYPFPGPGRIDLRRARVALQLRLFQTLSPGLDRLHPFAADMPQECTDITAQVFQSLRFEVLYRVPAYQDWLAARGHERAFRFHRRFLQHLDAQSPGRRWVLKSPDHVFSLDALHAAYPDAAIVFLHRDPVSVLGSCAALTCALRRPFSAVDRRETGRHVAARMAEAVQRMVSAVAQPNGGHILHLHYEQVVSAPMDAVAALYAHTGRSLSFQAEQRMRRWLARHPRRRRKRYDLEAFGLDPAEVCAHFAPYVERFGLAARHAI